MATTRVAIRCIITAITGDHTGTLWILEGKALRQVQVARGIDDGTTVEIVSGDLKPGDQVVIDESRPASAGKKPRTGQPPMGQMGGMHHF